MGRSSRKEAQVINKVHPKGNSVMMSEGLGGIGEKGRGMKTFTLDLNDGHRIHSLSRVSSLQ